MELKQNLILHERNDMKQSTIDVDYEILLHWVRVFNKCYQKSTINSNKSQSSANLKL